LTCTARNIEARGFSARVVAKPLLAKKYVSGSWAVHGVFAKFCIFSTPSGSSPQRAGLRLNHLHEPTVTGVMNLGLAAARISQNAGCMMAVHANCTAA
jgi:hypothetical protein